MRLTHYTSYSLRTLQMASLRMPDLVRVNDIVAAHRISRAHVVKIVFDLGRAGFIETHRGRSGGFRLARPADQIRVGDVVRVTEGEPELAECFNTAENTCVIHNVCRLSEGLHRAAEAFFEVLDDMTIADISVNRSELLRRLEHHVS